MAAVLGCAAPHLLKICTVAMRILVIGSEDGSSAAAVLNKHLLPEGR
jgi:hypothetical protein